MGSGGGKAILELQPLGLSLHRYTGARLTKLKPRRQRKPGCKGMVGGASISSPSKLLAVSKWKLQGGHVTPA